MSQGLIMKVLTSWEEIQLPGENKWGEAGNHRGGKQSSTCG